ncbi:MAG: hypothetical protein L3J39_00840, partial [Verrucomicrobiales bacterium]|nr:hypothetical protein [Verrucomicrobiales bacterium]
MPLVIPANSSIDVTVLFSPDQQTGYLFDLTVTSDSYYNSQLIGRVTTGGGTDPALPVTNLTAIPAGADQVDLSWDPYVDAIGDFASFRIYRSETAFTELADAGVSLVGSEPNVATTSYTDTTAINGISYYYAVLPRDTAGAAADRAGEFEVVGPISPNAIPGITNITAMQDPQAGTILVSYDLTDAENGDVQVWLEYWDGTTWQVAENVTGAVGVQQQGTGLIAIWNARQDSSLYVAAALIRVNAKDINNPAAVGQLASATFELDTLPPTAPLMTSGVNSPTKLANQILSGTRESNTALYVNGVEIQPAAVGVTAWSYDMPLVSGENSFALTSVDSYGNISPALNGSITYDDSPPAAPVVNPVASPIIVDTITVTGSKPIDTGLLVARWDSLAGAWLPLSQAYPDPSSGFATEKDPTWAIQIGSLVQGL